MSDKNVNPEAPGISLLLGTARNLYAMGTAEKNKPAFVASVLAWCVLQLGRLEEEDADAMSDAAGDLATVLEQIEAAMTGTMSEADDIRRAGRLN